MLFKLLRCLRCDDSGVLHELHKAIVVLDPFLLDGDKLREPFFQGLSMGHVSRCKRSQLALCVKTSASLNGCPELIEPVNLRVTILSKRGKDCKRTLDGVVLVGNLNHSVLVNRDATHPIMDPKGRRSDSCSKIRE